MPNLQLLELQNSSKTQTKDKCHSKSVANNLSTLSDKDLLALCQKYGREAILWKRKFIGLLPEVDRRELYLKKGCSSIYEFAAKFGGVTKKHTQRVIQIDKTFEEKGVKMLRKMLQEGAVSISKLVKVVSVVSVENESDLVTAVKNLSHESLETYVRDMRRTLKSGEGRNTGVVTGGDVQIGNGLSKPSDCPKSVRTNTFAEGVALKKLKLNLSEETLEELLELQEKGIDVDALLREFLRKGKEEIVEKKEDIAAEIAEREEKRRRENKEPSHYVGVKTKQILQEEFGTKCAVGGCIKTAAHLHHTVLFSINGSNSPDLLKPLCRAHHDIVHSMNGRYLNMKFRN